MAYVTCLVCLACLGIQVTYMPYPPYEVLWPLLVNNTCQHIYWNICRFDTYSIKTKCKKYKIDVNSPNQFEHDGLRESLVFLWKQIFILKFLVAYNSRQWNSNKSWNYCTFGSNSQDRFVFNWLFKWWYEDETRNNSFKLILFMINNICNMHYKVRKWDKIHHVVQQLRFCIIRLIININFLHVACGNAIWGWFDGW